MNKVLIFGHKNPDTDSVTSSIALTYLKNKLGMKAEARVLGNINKETEYVLKRFKFKTPRYLNDVKLQIKDVNYRKKYYINNKESILKAFNYMNEKDISTIPIVDDDNKFSRSLAMKDITRNQIMEDNSKLSTSYDNLLEAIKGKEILRFDEEIKGNIVLITSKYGLFSEEINFNSNDILIVEANNNVIEDAIKDKVKLLVITGNSPLKQKYIKDATKNKVNIIKTSYNSFNTVTKIGLSNYIKDLKYTKDLLCIDVNDYVNDIQLLTKKTKFSYYPIIDKNNTCLGLLKVADLNDKKPKQVILVDHNEYQQSVDGIDEAEILEIIDHHKIGTIGTRMPINFRNMPVGSTNTIIYSLYKENNIAIPKDIASIMLSGILSDTLVLNSPTTTEFDKKAVKELEKITNLNYKKYGYEMLKEGSNIKNKSLEEILYSDFKIYEENNKKIGIGISQVFTTDIDEILNKKEQFIDMLNDIAKNEKYDIVTLFITDVIKNGSYILYNNNAHEILNKCFKQNINEGTYLDGYVSRKKQIVPNIINIINNK